MHPKHYLAAVLFALVALYGAWFRHGAHPWGALLAFGLPPLLLAAAALLGWRRAGFTAALLALLWFCHGIMLAWAEPAQRLPALLEVALALLVVHAACLPGIRARRLRHGNRS